MASTEDTPTLLQALQRWTASQPTKTLYRFLGDDGGILTQFTYAEFDERTRNLALHLRHDTKAGLGLAPGTPVLLVFPPSLDFIIAFIACIRAGLIAVPVYPPDPRAVKNLHMFVSVQKSCGAALALTNNEYNWAKRAASVTTMFSKGDTAWPDLKWVSTDAMTDAASVNAAWASADLDQAQLTDVAFLQYTSGSTAEPKGVMVTHGNLRHNLSTIIRALKAGTDTVVVSWLPQYHDMGLIGSHLGSLYCGGSATIMSPLSFIRSPVMWIQSISKFHATHIQAPNFAYKLTVRKFDSQSAVKLADLDLSSVRHIFNAAEPIEPEGITSFLNKFGVAGLSADAMSPGYGLAEHTVYVCDGGKQVLRVDKAVLETERKVVLDGGAAEGESKAPDSSGVAAGTGAAPAPKKLISTIVGCGKPAANPDVDLIIVDQTTQQVLPEGLVGEIWVNSPSKAAGYWGRPELSTTEFHAMPRPATEAPTTETKSTSEDADVVSAVDVAVGAGGYLRTGDLGFLYNGELFICGRSKDLIIIRGRNHYPQDIERTAEQVGELRPGCSAAFSVNTNGVEHIVLLAELKDPKAVTPKTVASAIRKLVTDEHGVRPAAIVLLPPHRLPKTTSGKVARQWCKRAFEGKTLQEVVFEWHDSNQDDPEPEPAAGSAAGGAAAATQPASTMPAQPVIDIRTLSNDQLEEKVLDLISRVLGCDPADVNRELPLMEQGMSSMAASQLDGALQYELGLYFHYHELERATVKYIVQNRIRKSVPLELQQYDDGTPVEIVAEPQTPFCKRYFPCFVCCYK